MRRVGKGEKEGRKGKGREGKGREGQAIHRWFLNMHASPAKKEKKKKQKKKIKEEEKINSLSFEEKSLVGRK